MDPRYKPVIWYCEALGGWTASLWFKAKSTDHDHEQRQQWLVKAQIWVDELNARNVRLVQA